MTTTTNSGNGGNGKGNGSNGNAKSLIAEYLRNHVKEIHKKYQSNVLIITAYGNNGKTRLKIEGGRSWSHLPPHLKKYSKNELVSAFVSPDFNKFQEEVDKFYQVNKPKEAAAH